MFQERWRRIVEWFSERQERSRLVSDFNRHAKFAFVNQQVGSLLKARVVRGDSMYKHALSKWRGSGLEIIAVSGTSMDTKELTTVSHIILDQKDLVNKLISLGWDTLFVRADLGYKGVKWNLVKHGSFGGVLK